jgi:drug/metabolite transporter (DMT)-like permease
MSPATIGLLLVLASTLIEGVAQVCLKKSVLPRQMRAIWIAAAIVLFVLEALIYTGSLRLLDVSTAFAVSSVGFVATAFLAKWMLRENISPMRWAGIMLILAGCGMVAFNA